MIRRRGADADPDAGVGARSLNQRRSAADGKTTPPSSTGAPADVLVARDAEMDDSGPLAGDHNPAFAEPLPVRMLNEFAYCPRLFHLMHVEGRWVDNAFTADGRAVHRRVDRIDHVLAGPPAAEATATEDDGGAEGDPSPQIARSVSLDSASLGIVAKLDLVSTAGGEAVPVETKRGHVPDNADRSWEPERVQLMAQGLLLREHGYDCDHGFLYYRGSRTRVEVRFTEALERRTRDLIELARAAASAVNLPPPLDDSPKCRGCSLCGVCLPDETLALTMVPPDPARPDIRRLYPVRDDAVPLYVQEQGAQVGKRGETLVVRMKGEQLASARLHDVSQLVLCGNVSVTAQTIGLLTEAGVPIVHLSTGHWFHGVTFGMGLRNAYDRAAQFEAARDPVRKLDFARALVEAKIRNQRTMLRRNAEGLDGRSLAGLAEDAVACRDAGSTETLLGLEGAAAARYFGQFPKLLKGGGTYFPQNSFAVSASPIRGRRPSSARRNLRSVERVARQIGTRGVEIHSPASLQEIRK